MGFTGTLTDLPEGQLGRTFSGDRLGDGSAIHHS